MIPHSTPFDVTQAYEYTPCSSFGVPFSSSSTGLIKMPQASKSLTLEPNPEMIGPLSAATRLLMITVRSSVELCNGLWFSLSLPQPPD
jgi:hypothetical protein